MRGEGMWKICSTLESLWLVVQQLFARARKSQVYGSNRKLHCFWNGLDFLVAVCCRYRHHLDWFIDQKWWWCEEWEHVCLLRSWEIFFSSFFFIIIIRNTLQMQMIDIYRWIINSQIYFHIARECVICFFIRRLIIYANFLHYHCTTINSHEASPLIQGYYKIQLSQVIYESSLLCLNFL